MLLALVACGDSKNKQVDAPKSIDAAVTTVVAVDPCPATPAATFTESDSSFMFMPTSATINVGQVVKFVTSSTHNVVPVASEPSDPGLMVGFNQTKCLMFTQAGTFNFACGPHQFKGTVIVQ